MDSRLVILPTARKVEEELKRLSREGCVMGHRLMTFPQLIELLWREAASLLRLIDPIGERIAVDEAIRRTANDIAIAPSRGLALSLGTLIRQLKSAAVTPGDLKAAAASLPPTARPRIEMAAAVFAAYEDLLAARGLADPHDRERIVLAMLHQAERDRQPPRLLAGVNHLLIAELYDLSLLQFMIAASLIRLIGDADLTIQATSHKVDSNSFASLTWNRFAGEESIADKVLPNFVHRGGRKGQIGFALEHLFTGTAPEPPPVDGTITIIEAPDRLREAEQIARTIRLMLEAPATDGAPLKLERIAIVARDLAPYADYLESVFRRYRLPLCINHSRSLRATAPVRVLIDLLKLSARGYSRAQLTSLASSPYLKIGFAAGAARLMAEIGYINEGAGTLADRFALAIEVAQARAAAADNVNRQRWTRRIQRLERAATAFGQFLASCAPLANPNTLAGHVAVLDQLLADFRFNPAHDDADGHAIAAALRETFDAMARAGAAIAPDRVLSAEEFAAHLEEALSDRMLEPAASSSSAVQALSVLDARGLDFDCVFILGLNDGVFPRYHSDDPLIADELRPALNRSLRASLRTRFGEYAAAAPGPILRTRHHHNAEDWFLFFLALSMPEQRAIFSFASADERGNPLTRSPFVDEVLALTSAGETPTELLKRSDGGQFIPALASSFTRSELLNAAASTGLLEDPCAETIAPRSELDSIARRARIERHREDYLARPSREETDGHLSDPAKQALAGRFDGRVSADSRLRKLLLGTDDNPRYWSPAQFDELAACGFKFFAGRVLRLRADDDPGYEASPLETGDIVHRVLHDLLASQPDFSRREIALAAARELLREYQRREVPHAREGALFRIEWARIERIVDEFVGWEYARIARGEVPPSGMLTEHELRFTLDDTRTAPPDGPINLAIHGRMDRLEFFRNVKGQINRIRVIDYKTSRNAGTYDKLLKDEIFGVLSFQLPLYLIGALDEFADELAPKTTLEAGYLVLRNRDKEALKPFARELFATDPREHRANTKPPPIPDRLTTLAADAIAGHFDADPLVCSEYCAFRRVCRYNKAFA